MTHWSPLPSPRDFPLPSPSTLTSGQRAILAWRRAPTTTVSGTSIWTCANPLPTISPTSCQPAQLPVCLSPRGRLNLTVLPLGCGNLLHILECMLAVSATTRRMLACFGTRVSFIRFFAPSHDLAERHRGSLVMQRLSAWLPVGRRWVWSLTGTCSTPWFVTSSHELLAWSTHAVPSTTAMALRRFLFRWTPLSPRRLCGVTSTG